jgi:hypothetical protein
MLDANRTITITCTRYDGEMDIERDVSFTLDGVSIHTVHSGSASSGGVTASDLVKIRIPYRPGYLPEDQWEKWQKINPGNRSAWTLRVGDSVMVDGEKKTILSWHDNTRRRFEPHWYVEAR